MKIRSKKLAVALLCLFISCDLSSCKKKEEESEEEIIFQTLSTNISVIEEAYSSLSPFSYEVTKEESILSKQKSEFRDGSSKKKGYWWIANKVYNGTPKKEEALYKYTYDIYGNLLSRVEVPDSEQVIEAENTIYEYYGEIQPGSVFYPRFTTFGYDCGACYINEQGFTQLASGIGAKENSIRQMDDSWEDGILYEGYYMIAMTTDMPVCSIVEISEHGFEGQGLEPGVPFRAIVADRGVGANRIDLFVGSEKNLGVVRTVNKKAVPKVTVISLGKTFRLNGHRNCKV